jgi:tRNA nucleotidyltransferase (CCA-adding enzyme)
MKRLKFSRLPRDAQKLLREIGVAADERGLSAWLVGGMVRDLFLGRVSVDIDVVVEGGGIAFAGILAQRLGGRFVAHQRFGTATIDLENSFKLDIVTARRETYARPGILPEVFPGQLSDDLFRRDFTINAVAVSLNARTVGEVRDDFDGLEDLKGGLVRIMHYRSFVDDPTRILRAVRYEKRFGFQIEPRTLAALKIACLEDAFKTVTPVRYFNEFRRILEEKDPLPALRRLRSLDGVRYFIFGPAEERALAKVVSLQGKAGGILECDPERWHARLAAFLLYVDKRRREQILLELNCARSDKGKIEHCLSFMQGSGMFNGPRSKKTVV